jgi:Protein of unknown function (DUF2867)
MTATQADRGVVPGCVSQISLPADARAITTLSRVDYADAFIVDIGAERTAEQWARAVFNDTPLAVRARLVSGWMGLGLKLGGPWSSGRVLGWKVQRVSPSVMLLAADSWLGLQAQLLFRSQPNGLLFATLIRQNNQVARAVWVRMTSTHQSVVRSLLDHAARREARR